MRENTKRRRTAILMTDDPAVERAARDVAHKCGDILELLKSNADATCVAFDALASETFAILDADTRYGTRSMFHTVAGLLPVIAVTRREKPWLNMLLRHHRIGATVTKPVDPKLLQAAFRQIEKFHGPHERYAP